MMQENEQQKNELNKVFIDLFETLSENRIEEKSSDGTMAFSFDMLEEPLIGYASADDPIFESFKDSNIIGESYMLPEEWLQGAKTVISFAFPFSSAVKCSNRGGSVTSKEWLYARIEGQVCMKHFTQKVADLLKEQGAKVCIPSGDPRFSFICRTYEKDGEENFIAESTWSERHAAYACGLGTFGLSKGLITEKGVAVRFASLITDLSLPADLRPYQRYDEYCTRCGACVRNCPALAISLEKGKSNIICKKWVDETHILYKPRYGCGKCQVGVPCEGKNPRNGK